MFALALPAEHTKQSHVIDVNLSCYIQSIRDVHEVSFVRANQAGL